MNKYRITLKDDRGNVVEEFEQSAVNLRVALEVSTARLRGTAAVPGLKAASCEVELVKPKVEVESIGREVIPDTTGELSYGIGVRAFAVLRIPNGDDGGCIKQRVVSPGLWGIGVVSEDYLQSVYDDELLVLAEMLDALGVSSGQVLAAAARSRKEGVTS